MTGEEFKIIYKRMGFKTSKVAAALNITQQSVNAWFNYKNISTDILEKLCSISGYKINDFYKNTEYEYIPEKTENVSLSEKEMTLTPGGDMNKIVSYLLKELKEATQLNTSLQVDNALLTNKLKEFTSENAIRELLKKVG